MRRAIVCADPCPRKYPAQLLPRRQLMVMTHVRLGLSIHANFRQAKDIYWLIGTKVERMPTHSTKTNECNNCEDVSALITSA
jgi:hypothetical protein